MPDWLIQVIIQYPIVTVVGFVVWYANREVKEAHAGRLAREEANHATAVSEQKEFQRKLAEAKDAEIARLRDDLRKEVEKLAKKVDELNKRLGA